MVKFSWLALIALLATFMVFGCTTTAEDTGSDSDISTDEGTEPTSDVAGEGNDEDMDEGDDESASAGTEMTLAANASVDEDGDALCPVMENKVMDITMLEPQEYEGKTYYFC